MTNGEMIQKVFDCEVCEPLPEDDIIHVIFPDKNDSAIGFDWSWWNMEYKDPTAKNNLGVDCISREQALVAIRNLYPGMPRVDFNGSLRKWVDKYKPYIECDDAIKQLPPVTPQEPRCRDCKWWKDSDGEYRRGCGAESICRINTDKVYKGEGYCYMFELQESEDEK